MPFAGSFNVQASFGGITEDNIDSGTASAGDVLTADGSGGAAWQAVAKGAIYLGFVGDGDNPVTAGQLSSAYVTVTGSQPASGAFVFFGDATEGEPVMAIYQGDDFQTWMKFLPSSVI